MRSVDDFGVHCAQVRGASLDFQDSSIENMASARIDHSYALENQSNFGANALVLDLLSFKIFITLLNMISVFFQI